jgi:hypothetical protein
MDGAHGTDGTDGGARGDDLAVRAAVLGVPVPVPVPVPRSRPLPGAAPVSSSVASARQSRHSRHSPA